MKILFLASLMFCLCVTVKAQKCNCTIMPFKPDTCVTKCISLLLAKADPSELILIAGLSSTTSKEIENLTKNADSSILKNLQHHLTKKSQLEYDKKVKELTRDQIEYFMQPADSRKIIIANLKTLENNKRRS